MHDGCNSTFQNGQEVVDKVRQMGFSEQYMPMPLEITCKECGEAFEMETFESQCPKCKMVYGVTPCHAFDPDNVKAAGIDY
jgi:Zn finger protein HypA/HybF involved in hydrogenase expression